MGDPAHSPVAFMRPRVHPASTGGPDIIQLLHPLVEVMETDEWVVLECPMCERHVVRVWHGDGTRVERFYDPVEDPEVTHWWARPTAHNGNGATGEGPPSP